MFSCEFGDISKNTFCYRTPLVAASISSKFYTYEYLRNFSYEAVVRRCFVDLLCKLIDWFLYDESCNFIKKEALAKVLSCEFCEISKDTFFYRTPLLLKKIGEAFFFWNMNWLCLFFSVRFSGLCFTESNIAFCSYILQQLRFKVWSSLSFFRSHGSSCHQ